MCPHCIAVAVGAVAVSVPALRYIWLRRKR